MVIRDPETCDRLVAESTTLSHLADYTPGCVKSGVQAHPLKDRLTEHRGRIWHYPLPEPLGNFKSKLLWDGYRRHLHAKYEYAGAWHARRTPRSRLIRRLSGEDLNSLYSPEFVVAMYRYAGILDWQNASKYSPNALCQRLVETGVCKPRRRLVL